MEAAQIDIIMADHDANSRNSFTRDSIDNLYPELDRIFGHLDQPYTVFKGHNRQTTAARFIRHYADIGPADSDIAIPIDLYSAVFLTPQVVG